MLKKDRISQLVEDIRSLKIQSASTIAETSLAVIAEEIKKGKIRQKEELKEIFIKIENARITEPFVKNCFAYILWQIGRKNPPTVSEIVPYFDLLLDRLKLIKEQIVENGVSLIKDGFNVFTHCHSTNVEEILKNAFEEGTRFSVYLTETRPRFQGRITAENLVRVGIKVVMIADSLAAFLVSNKEKVRIDLVILGTDAIFPDGSCYNKVGSYGISLSAKSANIPLYVAGSLLKFSETNLLIEEREESEIWQEKPKNLKILNPAFDKIPANFISGYITEFGIIKPGKIEKTVRKNYPWIIKEKEKINKKSKDFKKEKTSYLHLGEIINKDDNIIATFRLETQGDLKEGAVDLAAESSIGTWTKVTTETEEVFKKLSAKVFDVDKKLKIIKVAYPLSLFEPGSIPQLLSSVAGNIFGMKKIKWLRLIDLDFPERYVKKFPGPAIGAEGIREITGVYNRPLIGCIIKPKMGLSWKEHRDVAMEVFEAGVDLVKDDENLTNQEFNPFFQRVLEICRVMKERQWFGKGIGSSNDKKKNKEKIYAFNVTAETLEMIERAKFVKENNGNCVMVDIITTGFAAVQSLRRQNLGLIIHGHRAMHGAVTKNKKHGISMLVIAKLSRLAGVDQLHTGTIVGKMEGEREEVLEINRFLLSEWFGLKKTLPIASGGLHPLLIPDLINILGDNVILNFGGGIHGHPLGVKAGVLAVRQALGAAKNGISLQKHAEDYNELKVAIEYWGKDT